MPTTVIIGNKSYLVIVSFEDEATGHARALGNALANEVHQQGRVLCSHFYYVNVNGASMAQFATAHGLGNLNSYHTGVLA